MCVEYRTEPGRAKEMNDSGSIKKGAINDDTHASSFHTGMKDAFKGSSYCSHCVERRSRASSEAGMSENVYGLRG